MTRRRTAELAPDGRRELDEAAAATARPPRRLARRLTAPIGAIAAVVARWLHLGGNSANVLQHEATNALGREATSALAHEATTAAGAKAAAAGTAPAPPGQGPSPQALGMGAAAVAVVVAIIAALALSGDPEPEPEPEAAPSTTTAPPSTTASLPPPQAPSLGPASFDTTGSDGLVGNVLAEVDQGDGADPVVVSAVEGSADLLGQPVTLASGATVTVEADGSFRYDPGLAFQGLGSGESATDSFSYTATAGPDWSEERLATITVTGVNDPPTLGAVGGVSVSETSSAAVDLSASDPDADAVSFRLEGSIPPFVSLVAGTDGAATLLVAPGPGDSGVYQVVVVATDDGAPALSARTTIPIDVSATLTRVTDGLLALYEFEEGSGSIVGDSSQVGSPYDLTASDPAALRWGDGSLSVDSPTLLGSVEPATKVSETVSQSNAVTVEAWVTPADAVQAGPARVVSLSADVSFRNVTLGQGDPEGLGGDHWTARLRSTATTENGLPSLSTPAATAQGGRLTHVVFTRSASGEAKLFLDGVTVATGTVGGDLSNWDRSFPLLLANETSGDRPWLGTFHLVAVYGKALSPTEVDRNHRVGP